MENFKTIVIFILLIYVIYILTRYINRKEIKFYEYAQMIETKLKDDDDVTLEEIRTLYNILKKLLHTRNERHRFVEVTKMIQVKFKVEKI